VAFSFTKGCNLHSRGGINMRIDLHTHPLSHRYSYDRLNPSVLTAKDEDDIKGLIAFGQERGLDAIGITDHDLALSGLWARNYALQAKLPIRVIAGCECELYFLSQWIHILALNITKPLEYTAFTPPDILVTKIKEQGGVSVLAHPMCYGVDIYHALKGLVDGIEYRNGAQDKRGRETFSGILDEDKYSGPRFYNSDYHYPDKNTPEQWNAVTNLDDGEFIRLFGEIF
jgi:predicted metal-dependent phosphoesterase TrpH